MVAPAELDLEAYSFAVLMAAGIITRRGASSSLRGPLAPSRTPWRMPALRRISSGLIGLVTYRCFPIVAGLLFATIIGFSFGLALLLLLPFLAVAGHTVKLPPVSASGSSTAPASREATAGSSSICWPAPSSMALVWLIPWAGCVVVGLAMLVGSGAWVRSVMARLPPLVRSREPGRTGWVGGRTGLKSGRGRP